jgi:hypothetical protein
MNRLAFSDEMTFQLMGRANQHKLRIQWRQNPYSSSEQERDGLKINTYTTEVVPQFNATQATISANIKLLYLLLTPFQLIFQIFEMSHIYVLNMLSVTQD